MANATTLTEHHGAPAGITRWLYTTNHKDDIGAALYLLFSLVGILPQAVLIMSKNFQRRN